VRKIIAPLLLLLGSFLIVVALVAAFWGGDAAKKTPLDTDSVTHLSGTADKLNPATGEVESLDVKATSVTKADAKRSDDGVVVFVNTTCLVIDRANVADCVDGSDDRLISASDDEFATDRRTAVAVNDKKYLPADAEEKSGLVNKWPFDAQKKDYQYWDGILGEAVPVSYEGTETLEGLPTYKYAVSVPETPAEVLTGISGIYSTEKNFWIDPVTGSIINQTQHEVRTLPEGDVLLDLQLGFTEDQVSTNVDAAKDNGRTLPVGAGVLGVVILALGAFLFVRNRRTTA
jgi:hypothetical protein